jgi:hypothetical protein
MSSYRSGVLAPDDNFNEGGYLACNAGIIAAVRVGTSKSGYEVCEVRAAMEGWAAEYVSAFTGRIVGADHDPAPIIAQSPRLAAPDPQSEPIRGGQRELPNIFQPETVGCHIAAATTDTLIKLCRIAKELVARSSAKMRMFSAVKAGYSV